MESLMISYKLMAVFAWAAATIAAGGFALAFQNRMVDILKCDNLLKRRVFWRLLVLWVLTGSLAVLFATVFAGAAVDWLTYMAAATKGAGK